MEKKRQLRSELISLHIVVFAAAVIAVTDATSSTSDVIEYRIQEEQPTYTLIGNVALDASLHTMYTAETLSTFRYHLLSTSTDNNHHIRDCFTLDSVDGLLRTSRTLDREQLCPSETSTATCGIHLDISVTPVRYFRIIRVVVYVEDVNDNAPKFPDETIGVSIYELAAPGARFPLPAAVDYDLGSNSIRDYLLDANGGPFRLLTPNVTNDQLTTSADFYLVLTDRLDRETTSTYSLLVTARDGGQPRRTATMHVTVVVLDANDNPPVFDKTVYELSVPEDTAIGTTIVRVSATDADEGDNARVIYRLSTRSFPASLAAGSSSTLAVDEDTGDVVLVSGLDRESSGGELIVGVVATDRPASGPPLSGYSRVVLHIGDVNDHAPSLSVRSLTADGEVAIPENSPAGSFVAHLSAADRDAGPNGRVRCHLRTDVVDASSFQLIDLAALTPEYKLVSAKVFDREKHDLYRIVVTCMDGGSPSLSADREILVRVADENDNRPVFHSQQYTVYVKENSPVGQPVVQLHAEDLDAAGSNSRLVYSIAARTAAESAGLDIDPSSGNVTTSAVFDFESPGTGLALEYVVMAVDQGHPPRSGTATLRVVVVDVNDNAPRFVATEYYFQVAENLASGVQIGAVSAVDVDSAPFNQVTYRLVGPSDTFYVDPTSGVLSTLVPLDRETVDVYSFQIFAENLGNVDQSSAVNVTVRVLDANDNSPLMVSPVTMSDVNGSTSICGRARRGDRLTRIVGRDVDAGPNAAIVYHLAKQSVEDGSRNAGGYFSLSTHDGWLVAERDLTDLDVGQRIQISVVLVDQGVPSRSSESTIALMISQRCLVAAAAGVSPPALDDHSLTVVVVSSLSILGLVLLILLCLVLVARYRRRRHRQNTAEIVKFVGVGKVNTRMRSAGRRRWTDADVEGQEEKGLKPRLAANFTTAKAGRTAFFEHTNPASGSSSTHPQCVSTGDCGSDRGRSCFNIQHEFQVVWQSSSSSSPHCYHPNQVAKAYSETLQPDLSKLPNATKQAANAKPEELSGKRQSPASASDTPADKHRFSYSEMLRHQLRDYDVTAGPRRHCGISDGGSASPPSDKSMCSLPRRPDCCCKAKPAGQDSIGQLNDGLLDRAGLFHFTDQHRAAGDNSLEKTLLTYPHEVNFDQSSAATTDSGRGQSEDDAPPDESISPLHQLSPRASSFKNSSVSSLPARHALSSSTDSSSTHQRFQCAGLLPPKSCRVDGPCCLLITSANVAATAAASAATASAHVRCADQHPVDDDVITQRRHLTSNDDDDDDVTTTSTSGSYVMDLPAERNDELCRQLMESYTGMVV